MQAFPGITWFRVLVLSGLWLGTSMCTRLPDSSLPAGTQYTPHFTYTTALGTRTIDCDTVDVAPQYVAPHMLEMTAPLPQAGVTLYLTYPADSSQLAAPTVPGQYPVSAPGDNVAAFALACQLPGGRTGPLTSQPGQSDSFYHAVGRVQYLGRDGEAALFLVKSRFRMLACDSLGDSQVVQGDLALRVRAHRR